VQPPVNIRVTFDEALTRAFSAGKGTLDGLKSDGKGGFLIVKPKATIAGLVMGPKQAGNLKIQLGSTKPSVRGGEITITQRSAKGVDGGVTLRLATKK
jgi:hypothetical protein